MDVYDAEGNPLPPVELTPADEAILDEAASVYPPERLNPWLSVTVPIDSQPTDVYVRKETDGTYSEMVVKN